MLNFNQKISNNLWTKIDWLASLLLDFKSTEVLKERMKSCYFQFPKHHVSHYHNH